MPTHPGGAEVNEHMDNTAFKTMLKQADALEWFHIPVKELPNGVDDVVHFEEKDDQKLFRTESAHHGHGAAFHGHGV